jgi:hypothetical protein
MFRYFAATCLALATGAATACHACGDVLLFTIDSSKSSLTLGVETLDGTPITTAQTPGSDTTIASGTAKIDVTPTTIQLLTTADTQFALQPAAQSPLPGGAAGSAPAQFGLTLSVPGVASGVVAARDYVGDATSPVVALSGTSFDASQVTLDLPTGNTDYNLTVLGNPVVGSFTDNNPALNTLTGGTFTASGGVYTLTLPLLVKGPATVGGVTLNAVYSGLIVATAMVPEPGTLALAALGAVLLLGRSRLSRRRAVIWFRIDSPTRR